MNAQQLSRREFLYLGGLAGAGAVLAACAPKPTEAPTAAPTQAPAAATEAPAEPTAAPPEPTEAPPAAVEEATIVYLTWSESNDPHFNYMVERWNDTHPEGPRLQMEYLRVGAGDEAITKAMNAIAAGSGVPDIFPIETSQVSKFLKGDPPLFEQHLVEIMPLLDMFNPNWREDYIGFSAYTWQGKVFAVEVGLAPCGYYYRKDLFDEVGIEMPLETWEDWWAAGERMAQAGHAMCAYDLGTMNFIMPFYQSGARIFDPDTGEVALEDKRAYKSLELVIEGAKAGIQWVTNEYWGAPHFAALNDGTVAGVLSAIWYSPHILKPNVVPENVGKWRVQHLPAWKTTPPWGGPEFERRKTSKLGGSGLVIPKVSAHPDLSWEFLAYAFLTEEGARSVFQNMGQMPMLKSVIHDDSVTGIPDEFYGGQAVNKVFADVADDYPLYYPHPFMNEAGTELGNIMLPAYEGEGTYEELIKQAADAIRAVMAVG